MATKKRSVANLRSVKNVRVVRSAPKSAAKFNAKAVSSTAYEVWLAGLGALVVAQREGRKQYSMLVKQGQSLEKRMRELAKTPLSDTTRSIVDAAQEMTGRAQSAAQATMKQVQKAMADQVGRAAGGLGLANAPDFGQLQQRVEEMMANVQSVAKIPVEWTKSISWPASLSTKPAKSSKSATPAKRATKTVRRPAKKAAKK